MTTHLRAQRPHPHPTEVPDAPAAPGFVLHVGVDDSFGRGPQALRDLIEAAETLEELARDLLPQAHMVTTLCVTPPAADGG